MHSASYHLKQIKKIANIIWKITMKVFIHPQIKNNFKFFGLQKSSKWVDVELAGGRKLSYYHHQMVKFSSFLGKS